MAVYLDCNATTPLAPAVRDAMFQYFDTEYGNAGSRTHEYGLHAKRAVEQARQRVASLVGADLEEVFFTSGATESNNLALLGLAPHGEGVGKKHIITTTIEHKAVLEPCEVLAKRGFEITLLAAGQNGIVSTAELKAALRPDTLLVSVMHVNNETGIIQPLDEICSVLANHGAYLHVDAAQGFGKELSLLNSKRIDLISVSGHKIYGPKGIGTLIARRRNAQPIPLQPLMVGGGQERGLRPGTLPVPLIVGLGVAAELARTEHNLRQNRNSEIRQSALGALYELGAVLNGDQKHCISSTINFSIPGLDSEAFMLASKDLISVSNGSACTSQNYQPSHVLTSMGLSEHRVSGAIRLSWCHMTDDVDWSAVVTAIKRLL